MTFLFVLLSIALFAGPFLLLSWWTQVEFSYVLGLIMNHSLHINYFIALLITLFFNAFAVTADVIITILRGIGAI